jgi:hypothetical protein
MLGAVVLPWTAGALADAAGLGAIPTFLAAVAGTLAAVVVWILRDRQPQAT